MDNNYSDNNALFPTTATAADAENDELLAAALAACEEDNLNLTFEDIEEEDALMRNLQAVTMASAVAVAARSSSSVADNGAVVEELHSSSNNQHQTAKKPPPPQQQDEEIINEEEYILGTLIVRVVAARDLEPVRNGGRHHGHNIGNLLFGGGNKGQSRRSGHGGGTANPYASVRFGPTTQRTSHVFDNLDPIWPRNEALYMDVKHAAWETTFDDDDDDEEVDGRRSDEEDTTTSTNKKKPPPGQPPHPGDPPKKPHQQPSAAASASVSSSSINRRTNDHHHLEYRPPSPPILTVAIFHTEMGSKGSKALYNPSKHNSDGDSDDSFLGMAAVDLTHVLTGKIRNYDEWMPLSGTSSTKASVRIVCEYEPSDGPPHPGDRVKFTNYCPPADLYPACPLNRVYTVDQLQGDEVLISYITTPENWVVSFQVHRYMLICIHRHHSVMNICQDELASLKNRLSHSPLVQVVQETVDRRVPEEGLLFVGADAVQHGLSLLQRWVDGGLETTVQDLNFATNWDGQHNPSITTDSLLEEEDATTDDNDDENNNVTTSIVDSSFSGGAQQQQPPPSPSGADETRLSLEPLPNMPPCPITGEPMLDPVVAADGHTYERTAIARWLQTSNKSPLTGSVLPHKELVPNYMLLSSLQEAASSTTIGASPSSTNDDEATAVVSIDD